MKNNYENMWNMLYERICTEEDKYYDLAYKEIEKNNPDGNLFLANKASVFQQIRYMMDDINQ